MLPGEAPGRGTRAGRYRAGSRRTRDGPVGGLRRRERVVADARGANPRLRHRARPRPGSHAGVGCLRAGRHCGRRLGCGGGSWGDDCRPAGIGGLGGRGSRLAVACGHVDRGVQRLVKGLVGAFAGDLAVPFAGAGLLPPNDSRSRRATGASTVDDADLTNSPCSLSRARTSLLVTPSSLANSCTRALPAATTSPVHEATVVGRASGLAMTHCHRDFTVCSCSIATCSVARWFELA